MLIKKSDIEIKRKTENDREVFTAGIKLFAQGSLHLQEIQSEEMVRRMEDELRERISQILYAEVRKSAHEAYLVLQRRAHSMAELEEIRKLFIPLLNAGESNPLRVLTESTLHTL